MKIFEKELFALSKVFFDHNYPVFVLDPGGHVKKNFTCDFVYITKRNQVEQLGAYTKKHYLINVSGANTFSFPLNFKHAESIISFSQSTETSMDFYHKDLYYFVDEYHRISWIVSENHRVTDFLQDMDKAKSLVDLNNFLSVFPYTWKYFMLKMGNIRKIADGRIQLFIRNRFLFQSLSNQAFDSYSIKFSQYQDGIIRFKFYQGKKTLFFIKKSWNGEGRKKLEHEYEISQEIRNLKLEKAEIPEIKKVNNEYLSEFSGSFRQPESYQWNSGLYHELEDAICELSEKTAGKTRISRLWRNENLQENLIFIQSRVKQKLFPNGLGILNFVKIFTELTKYYDEIDTDVQIDSAVAIRKMIPDFLGYANKKVFFSNLEMAETFYPLQFDSFDFIFHTSENQEQPDSEKLIEDIEYLFEYYQEKNVRYKKEDFIVSLKIFLIIHIIPELAKLLVKPVLPPEENLRLLLWAEVIDFINDDFQK